MPENGSDYLTDFQNKLNYYFKDKKLLEIALTHKSFTNEIAQKDIENNERFEFLGDSVLGLVISDFLIKHLPNESEGLLSKLKGYIVSKTFLFEIAKELDLGMYLRIGRGEENSGGRSKRSILVDSLEAIIAAIYLDGGFQEVHTFILYHMEEKIQELAAHSFIPDYKTVFQEYTQSEFSCIPTYKVMAENGVDHDPEFEISIFVEDKCYGQGKGKSKRDAEQKAAYNALINLKVEGIF